MMVCMAEKLGTSETFWEDSGTGTRGFRNQEFGFFQVVATAIGDRLGLMSHLSDS